VVCNLSLQRHGSQQKVALSTVAHCARHQTGAAIAPDSMAEKDIAASLEKITNYLILLIYFIRTLPRYGWHICPAHAALRYSRFPLRTDLTGAT
jgi:hypothetical protein